MTVGDPRNGWELISPKACSAHTHDTWRATDSTPKSEDERRVLQRRHAGWFSGKGGKTLQ